MFELLPPEAFESNEKQEMVRIIMTMYTKEGETKTAFHTVEKENALMHLLFGKLDVDEFEELDCSRIVIDIREAK